MQAILFVADDIQTLSDGKILTVGLYADRVLIFQHSAPTDEAIKASGVPGIAQLCLMVTLVGLPIGKFEMKANFLAPDGSEFAKQIGPSPVVVEPGRSANLVFKIAPFGAAKAGKYRVSVDLGAMQFTSEFEVRFANAS